ncbi:MAG: IS701 family transposase [Pyrinomonadaceae bacterium]
MNLLETFESLLQPWSDVFPQQRTFARASRLIIGLLCCLRVHLLSNAICAVGRQGQDWSADYRLLARSPWNPLRLFDAVIDGLLPLLPAAPEPLLVALDDTICKKTGRKIPGVATLRDPLSPPFHVNFMRGLRFVQASLLLSPAGGTGPARALPLRFEPAPLPRKPKKKAPDAEWQEYRQLRKAHCLSQVGVRVLASLRQALNDRPATRQRQLIALGDGSYTNRTVLSQLPERTTLIGRLRKDAKLNYPLLPLLKTNGRPRRYGSLAPTPEQLLRDKAIPTKTVRCFIAGKIRKLKVKTLAPLYWRKAGAAQPLRLVVIKPLGYQLTKRSKLLYRQPAFLICTDPALPLQALVQAYLYRWEIECNHRDEKSFIGVAEGQVRAPLAVDRLPQFQVAGYSLLLLAALLTYGFGRSEQFFPLPKWRGQSIRPSILDLLNLFRASLFARASAAKLTFAHFASTAPQTTKSAKVEITSDRLATIAA